ncbi:MAG: FMN-binding negative transcriptional regulator [Herminiimonas sp.]|nr:FMN-binding negative transcriptional regulator [Herminiimonas sp.]
MYLPPAFREDRIDVQHDLIRTHPLGLLITAGPGGLMANPVPFLVYAEEGGRGTLRAHVSRANPVLQELAAVPECLIVFQGPQHYVTPSWYATKEESGKVVPTWNYVTVHAWGAPRVVDDGAWLRRQLEDLTRSQERARPAPWSIDDAPGDFIAAQMKGITGVEISITRVEGKWKLSQNRLEADRQGVADGLRTQSESGKAMADLIAAMTRNG